MIRKTWLGLMCVCFVGLASSPRASAEGAVRAAVATCWLQLKVLFAGSNAIESMQPTKVKALAHLFERRITLTRLGDRPVSEVELQQFENLMKAAVSMNRALMVQSYKEDLETLKTIHGELIGLHGPEFRKARHLMVLPGESDGAKQIREALHEIRTKQLLSGNVLDYAHIIDVAATRLYLIQQAGISRMVFDKADWELYSALVKDLSEFVRSHPQLRLATLANRNFLEWKSELSRSAVLHYAHELYRVAQAVLMLQFREAYVLVKGTAKMQSTYERALEMLRESLGATKKGFEAPQEIQKAIVKHVDDYKTWIGSLYEALEKGGVGTEDVEFSKLRQLMALSREEAAAVLVEAGNAKKFSEFVVKLNDDQDHGALLLAELVKARINVFVGERPNQYQTARITSFDKLLPPAALAGLVWYYLGVDEAKLKEIENRNFDEAPGKVPGVGTPPGSPSPVRPVGPDNGAAPVPGAPSNSGAASGAPSQGKSGSGDPQVPVAPAPPSSGRVGINPPQPNPDEGASAPLPLPVIPEAPVVD